jgi:nucleoside-diphosphate-sugar epimerase
MKYIVTGGAGFIGSHMAEFLIQAGHDVHVLDNLLTGKRQNLTHLESVGNFTFHELDVAHHDALIPILRVQTQCSTLPPCPPFRLV